VVDKNVESVTVNGMIATIEGETYSMEDLTLQPGENAVQVVAVDKAGNETVETFTLFFDPRARATYRYDLNGNLIQKTERGVVWRYEWDAENRLVRVRKATTEGAESTEIEYAYYDNGNRAWKRVTEPGQEPVVTHYVHDGIHVIAEYNGEGTLLKEYVYSGNIDEVLNIKDGTENLFLHQDGLNSVVAVTDADGERVASYNYEAFGTIKDATGALDNPITYTGRWFEPETGDYFYRARYYDSGVGRFLKRDPIGFKSNDYNFYRYVLNNPMNKIDPYGLDVYLKTGNKNAKIPFTNIHNPVQDLLHQKVCVDHWSPTCKYKLSFSCYSYMMILPFVGEVYRDETNGIIEDRAYTCCEDDKEILNVLESMVHLKGVYNFFSNCRTWSQKTFYQIKYEYSKNK
jgi:RHS repeat-associated protein